MFAVSPAMLMEWLVCMTASVSAAPYVVVSPYSTMESAASLVVHVIVAELLVGEWFTALTVGTVASMFTA